jgi:acyl-CoA dehydrogenase
MNAEIELLEESAARLFADHVDARLYDAVAAGEFPDALWGAVTEAGFERAEMPVLGAAVARVMGRHAAPVPLVEAIGDIALGPDGSLTGTAARVPWARHARHLVVVCGDGTLALIEASAAEISSGANLAGEPRDDVRLNGAPAMEAHGGLPPDAALQGGALLRAAAIAGALEAVLGKTVQYASERKQFGRPIAKFQAIQHHLAALAGHAAAASAAVAAAAEAPDFVTVAAAKAIASEAAGEAAAIAHQVHGAIGFTHEHDLHRLTKALWAWREEFGSEAEWNSRLGEAVAARGGAGLWPDVVARDG